MAKGKYKIDKQALTDITLKGDSHKNKKYKFEIPKNDSLEVGDDGAVKVTLTVYETSTGTDTASTTLKDVTLKLDKGFIRNGFIVEKVGDAEVESVDKAKFNTKGFTRTIHATWISLTVLTVIGIV